MSFAMCALAVRNLGTALKFVPDEFKSPGMCELAVQNTKAALKFVPENLKTSQVAKSAVPAKKARVVKPGVKAAQHRQDEALKTAVL